MNKDREQGGTLRLGEKTNWGREGRKVRQRTREKREKEREMKRARMKIK